MLALAFMDSEACKFEVHNDDTTRISDHASFTSGTEVKIDTHVPPAAGDVSFEDLMELARHSFSSGSQSQILDQDFSSTPKVG